MSKATTEQKEQVNKLFSELKHAQEIYLLETIPPHRKPTAKEYNDSLLLAICGSMIGMLVGVAEETKKITMRPIHNPPIISVSKKDLEPFGKKNQS